MNNLTAIVKATRASASALAAQQRRARRIADLDAVFSRLGRELSRLPAGSDEWVALTGERLALAHELDRLTKARRAAHRRWTNAQAVLAANALPGDAK